MPCNQSIRSELLDLLPETAHTHGLGRAATEHLLWLIKRTRVVDWLPGNRAVVYMAVAEIAALRGITPRQVNNHEQSIARAFGLGVVAPGCRRYGQRAPESGRIITASGFELTGLALALPILREIKAEFDEINARRRSRQRELTAARGQVRRLVAAVTSIGDAAQIDAAQEIAARICARISDADAANVRALEGHILTAQAAVEALQALLLAGKTCGSDVKTSDMSEENFRHIQPSTDSLSPLTGCGNPVGDTAARKPAGSVRKTRPAGLSRKARAARPEIDASADYDGPAHVPAEATGAYRVGTGRVITAASARFRAHLPPTAKRRPTTSDIVEAAREVGSALGISRDAWSEACQIVGAYPAALCVLVADRAVLDREIASPGGYFRSMVRRARQGDLHVDRSIFGLACEVSRAD